ncbi:MAG: PadR family transcriptional regulator [Armatimonadetes bacterium]|nr:PadR family transcriptional regulator [Armatimonadota bacterium]
MGFDSELLKGNFITLLLAVLSRHGEMYGYEIAQKLSDETEGRISPGQSTLYPALHQLEADGHVVAHWREVGGRKRKYYAITSSGKRELARRQEEWRQFQKTLNAVLGTA